MKQKKGQQIDRRNFLTKSGAAVIAGTILPGSKLSGMSIKEAGDVPLRTLGRTGFKVYPVAMGGFCQTANVFKYAMDMGVNHIDTAEAYFRGNSERTVGKAIAGVDRNKLFISTKLWIEPGDTRESILERYRKCLERLGSDYYDALYSHGVEKKQMLNHKGFHEAVAQLKSEGRVKHAGISCHGPEDDGKDSFEDILMAAAGDGRFDLMLFSYNFMNKDEAGRVIRFCKEKNVGAVAMKTAPGIESPFGEDSGLEPLDPMDENNLSKGQEEFLKEIIEEDNLSRQEALEEISVRIDEYNSELKNAEPYIMKYGATTAEELRKVSLKWVLENPDMNTVTITMDSFSAVDTFVPMAVQSLSQYEREMIRDYASTFNNKYCRHGCSACVEACPHKLPVSRIMRYAYYFRLQGREKYAMTKYLEMADRNADLCRNCEAPCLGACPHGVNIQANLLKAHRNLTLA